MSKKRLKRRSEVWEHFEEAPDGQRATCKYCANDLSANSKNGTSQLIRHLKSCKKSPQEGLYRRPTLVSRNEAINMGLTWDKTREDLVKKAIKEEIPFASSECRKLWHNQMEPMDVEKEIFTYYEHAKEKLAIELKDLTSRVSFSIQVLKEVGYMSITAHFIDKNFNLMRKLIGFKKLSNAHSDACIADIIKSCISEWKLGDKIFTFIAGDNSSNMKKNLLENFSSKMLLNGKFVNEPSCKEVLTQVFYGCLCDEYNFKRLDIEKYVEDLTTVPSRLAAFNEIAAEKGLNPVNTDWLNEYRGHCPRLYCGHREHWNLAAKMFKEVIIYKDVFRQYFEPGPFSLSESNLCPIDWIKVEFAVQSFGLFTKIIDGLSAYNHPTSSLCFPYTAELRLSSFRAIFYYERVTNLFKIANALDPRYKLIFSKYYWKMMRQQEPYWNLDEQIKEVFSAYENEEIKETSLVCIEHTNREHQGSSSKSAILSRRTIHEFSKFVRELKNTEKSELDKYLDDELVDLDDASFNLLGWWKQNRLRYPILSKMARDILAVPSCVYSIEGIISSDFKVFEGLSPELVEAVICSKDWILSDVQSMPESNS